MAAGSWSVRGANAREGPHGTHTQPSAWGRGWRRPHPFSGCRVLSRPSANSTCARWTQRARGRLARTSSARTHRRATPSVPMLPRRRRGRAQTPLKGPPAPKVFMSSPQLPPAILCFSSGKLRTTPLLIPRDLAVGAPKPKKTLFVLRALLCHLSHQVTQDRSVPWWEGGRVRAQKQMSGMGKQLRRHVFSPHTVLSACAGFSLGLVPGPGKRAAPRCPEDSCRTHQAKNRSIKNPHSPCVREHVLGFTSGSCQPLPPGAPRTPALRQGLMLALSVLPAS